MAQGMDRDPTVTPALVRHIARLARLDLDDGEIAGLTLELARILGHVEALASVEVGGTTPLDAASPLWTGVPPSTTSDLRADDPAEGLDRAREVMAGAPAVDTLGAFFLVPKVLGDGP